MTNLHIINNGKRTRKLLIIISLLISIVQVVRAQQIGSGWTINCPDFSGLLNSGTYEGCNPINGVPDAAHPWQHLLVLRHSNTQNNHQFQLGTSYSENDRMFFRKIASGLEPKNTIWNELATRGANNFIGNQIFNEGNIGIGTDNPLSGLNVFKLNDYNGGSIRFGYSGAYDGLLSFGWNPSTSRDAMKFSYFPHNSLLNQIDLMTLDINGNVGIGTTTINNVQGWNRVVDEYASGHAKLLVRTDNVITGIFSHDTWNGTVGRIGTESPHDLRLMAGYGHEVMSLTISGNVGIGTITPKQTLEVAGSSLFDSDIFTNQNGGIFFSGNGSYSAGIYGRNAGTDLVFNSGGTEKMRLSSSGNLGIGSQNPDQKLTVKGKIHAEEVIIDLAVPADYVFKPNYKLMPLHQVEQFVKTNSHLPEIPSANEITKNGLSVGEMQNKLLQKVEELTLYAIEMKKEINVLKEENKRIRTQLDRK